jgi:chloramphenicol-sensitive protein RarD
MPLSPSTLGFFQGLSAYVLWGFFPLYFHLLRDVPATEVLMHRVIWSFLLVLLVVMLLGRRERLWQTLRTPALRNGLMISSLLISINWLVFIWAVAQGRVVETSLGYFITPLVSVFLARVILGERLDRWRQLAILLAALGLAWLVWRLGELPWVALLLALSFGLYGLARKQIAVDTLTGLTVETGLLLPFALGYGLWLYADGWPAGRPALDGWLLVASGAVTALPLLLFAAGARRMSLSAIGFLMYVNPTMQFLTAVFLLGEPFDRDQLVGFLLIWTALLLFSLGSLRFQRAKPA